ncbi:MAG: hypothetical protein U1E49_21615, partial [Hyphomicrobiaceae bacterium]
MSEFAIANPSSPDLASIAKIVKIVPLPSGQERGLDGTGTYIGPHQVLTAAHIVYYLIGNEPALRAYVGQVDVGAAMGAAATTPFDVAAMPVGADLVLPTYFDFIRDFAPTGEGSFNPSDIVVLNAPAITHSDSSMSLGIAWGTDAAVAEHWSGVEVESAGYPRSTQAGEAEYSGQVLYRTSDTLTTGDPSQIGAEFRGLEIHSSQSGSGVWTIDPETGAQVLIGIATVFDTESFYGGGLLLTRDDYLRIASSFQAAGVTADKAPVEYLYGSDNGSLLGGGDVETITGTYLREIIRGDSVTGLGAFAGNDRLTGGGGSDVLQGMAGDDSLVGDGAGVSAAQIGNDFLDGGQNSLTFGHDTVL